MCELWSVGNRKGRGPHSGSAALIVPSGSDNDPRSMIKVRSETGRVTKSSGSHGCYRFGCEGVPIRGMHGRCRYYWRRNRVITSVHCGTS